MKRPYLAILVGTAFCSRVFAQNMLENGTFDTDLSGWTADPGDTPVWFAEDCCGNVNSGSARLSVSVTESEALNSNCVGVTAGDSYDVRAMTNTLPLLGAFLSNAFVNVIWVADASCVGAGIAESTLNIDTTPGWRQVGETIIAPDGAAGVIVQLAAHGQGLSTGVDAYFDDVRFGPAGSVPVTLQSFYVD